MIDWVDAMCRTWGIAKRKLDLPSDRRLTKDNAGTKTDLGMMASGPARSFLGRFREGGHVGRGKELSRLVEPLDGLRGDALTISLAIQNAIAHGDLGDRNYEQLYVHYVLKPKNAKKFKYFRMKRHEYYGALHNLHIRIAAWIRSCA